MVRELCVLPFGCHRLASSVLKTTDFTACRSRRSASTNPTGPPPTIATGAVSASVVPMMQSAFLPSLQFSLPSSHVRPRFQRGDLGCAHSQCDRVASAGGKASLLRVISDLRWMSQIGKQRNPAELGHVALLAKVRPS